jgi:peptidyl-prolyl cis-trans isomerase C
MKYLICSLFALGLTAFGQDTKSAEVPPDAVVLKVGGRSVTAAEFNRLISVFQPEVQQAARNNPRTVIQSYFLMENLSRKAIEEKLDQTSPIKEQLEIQKMQFLATQLINRESASIAVSDEEAQQRYEQEKDTKYDTAKIRGIVIMYTDPKTATTQVDLSNMDKPKVEDLKGIRLEADAKSIARKVVQQLREGADFEKLAREYSDDKRTAMKGGDFGTVRHNEQLPDEVKKAVFALKEGEVSDPVKQPLRYYILKVEKRSVQPYADVKQLVENEIRQEKFQKWMAAQQKQFEVTVENPDFFIAKPAEPPKKATAANTEK